MAYWVHKFSVEPDPSHAITPRFPLDMLRYDACYPATGDDVATLSLSLDPMARVERLAGSQPVRLIALRDSKRWAPSPRWPSFGWRFKTGTHTVQFV